MSRLSKKFREENYLQVYWRPMMAWSYFVICLWDFFVAPIFFAWFNQKYNIPNQPWKPLTLGESGMYHIAMGAIIGASAWMRGKEKIAVIESVSQNTETKTS